MEGDFYCIIGDSTIFPNLVYNVKATLVTENEVKCKMPTYEGILSSLTAVPVKVSYNLKEFTGNLVVKYFPAIDITDFDPKIIIQSQA